MILVADCFPVLESGFDLFNQCIRLVVRSVPRRLEIKEGLGHRSKSQDDHGIFTMEREYGEVVAHTHRFFPQPVMTLPIAFSRLLLWTTRRFTATAIPR